jgi:Uma2 family endonuclease
LIQVVSESGRRPRDVELIKAETRRRIRPRAEPDVAVVPPAHYDDAHPETAFLLVEVADASLRKDRVLESELYARAGVPEYWIVNLADRSIEVRKNPANDAYTALDTFVAGDTIRLAAFDAAITVSDILR